MIERPPTSSRPDPRPSAEQDRHAGRPVLLISRRNLSIAGAAAAALLGLGVWLVVAMLPGFLTRPGGSTTGATTGGAPAGTERRIQATLFYVSNDGQELIPVARQVTYGATPVEQARRIVEAVVEPPPDGLRSPIPAGTIVRSVFMSEDQRAFVDLGGAIVAGHSGGTLNEALTVYAIVNALTVNLPDVTSVQILIEGRQVDTLAGHLDLRYPLGKALEWVRKGQ